MSRSSPTRIALAASALLLSGMAASAQGIQLDLQNGRLGIVPPREERRAPRDDDGRRGRPFIEDERAGISCGQGSRAVRSRGFRDVRTIDCGGRNYVYSALQRGEPVEVRVSSRDGRIMSVQPF
jgi:hypothetical protein